MSKKIFSAIIARQSDSHQVVSIVATADEILEFATIDRIGRDAQGQLSGFQRPQIAGHIREIRDYLEKPDAVLPNPIVVAFTEGISIISKDGDSGELTIDLSNGPHGFVVDGQQRLTALSQIDKKMKVFVSILVCKDDAELRRQFVLINSTRPLPKSLIYELLPTVDGLSERLTGRSLAAGLTARLNFDADSSLKGKIYQHTNPDGIIRDTAIQRVIINSLNDGVMRELNRRPNGNDECFRIVSEFYLAVRTVFKEDWENHTPNTSRLVHGAGIIAMGYVMETLALLNGARTWEEFSRGLACLKDQTAWTSGEWKFSADDTRNWKAIQNLNRDIVTLAHYLIGRVRSDMRSRRGRNDEAPLLETVQ
jgi:DGQHR domain-containing protein